MIIEELLEFNRSVLSKEQDEETRLLKMNEFLQSKGFTTVESQQLLIDCLGTTGQPTLIYPLVLFLVVTFCLVLILATLREGDYPIFFTISAGVIGVLLLAICLTVKQILSNERKKISNAIRKKVDEYRLRFSDN